MTPSSIYFLLFCLLITFRDVFTQLILSPKVKGTLTPVVVLFVYCWASTLLAWLFYALRNRRLNVFARWMQLTSQQQRTFVKLGVATWLVYFSTIFGITWVGAAIFNVIDYAGMPLITVIAGHLVLREVIPARRIVFAIFGIAGVFMLFIAFPKPVDSTDQQNAQILWYFGIVLALSSTFVTSYTSALQKKQLAEEELYPDEVLLFRFPIPAVITTAWMAIERPQIDWMSLLGLFVIAAVGVFLPLLLLCFGFMRASLGQFSRFLFLIPVLTWIVIPATIDGELEKLSDWRILVGAGLLLFAFVTSEYMERRVALGDESVNTAD